MPHGIKYKQDKIDELGRGKVNFTMFTSQNACLNEDGYVEMTKHEKQHVYKNFVNRVLRAAFSEDTRHKVLVYRRDPNGGDLFSSDHQIIARYFSRQLLEKNPDLSSGIRYYIYDVNNSLVKVYMSYDGEGFYVREPFSGRIWYRHKLDQGLPAC